MSSRLNQSWLPIEKIEQFVQLEPALLITGLALGAWITSRIFLRQISEDRKRNLNTLFKNLSYHLLLGTGLFLAYSVLHQLPYQRPAIERFTTYVGFITILVGAIVFVKVWRIFVFEYLLLSHMKVPFPVLLVNLFTLLLSIVLAAWICAEIFSIRLTPLLATSAIFSLVLGLALQDTLGHLFAGVALQFDKPYEIGDWIEIQSTGQKWVGKVHDISWRATILVSFTDETITVPNRVVAQAQISNYSTKLRPIIRSQVFRLPFGVDIELVKGLLVKAIQGVPEIRTYPAPRVMISETTESWVGFKLVYFIDDFGRQFFIIDTVISRCLAQLEAANIELASQRLVIQNDLEYTDS